nr:MAG TPA: hypothetical protein [Caudoviricetes sp.]
MDNYGYYENENVSTLCWNDIQRNDDGNRKGL